MHAFLPLRLLAVRCPHPFLPPRGSKYLLHGISLVLCTSHLPVQSHDVLLKKCPTLSSPTRGKQLHNTYIHTYILNLIMLDDVPILTEHLSCCSSAARGRNNNSWVRMRVLDNRGQHCFRSRCLGQRVQPAQHHSSPRRASICTSKLSQTAWPIHD